MKLRQYLKDMDEFTDKNPEALDYEVIASSDDEGNGFNKVFYSPTVGVFDGYDFEEMRVLDSADTLSENEVFAVCIN